MPYQEIYKCDEYIIVNKPADLLTHQTGHTDESSLADELLKDYPEISEVGDDPARPGIVHRLDKLVSGLLIVARTPENFDNLKKQFQNRTIEKYYTALVFGKIEKDEAEINFPIKRSSQGNKMAALPLTTKGEPTADGREAITQFKVIKRFINYTLLDVRIKTGRTHQIRVHLAALSHPIVGDDLYGTRKTKLKNKKLELNRIFLHAYRLKFKDLQGEGQEYKIDLPDELDQLLNTNIK